MAHKRKMIQQERFDLIHRVERGESANRICTRMKITPIVLANWLTELNLVIPSQQRITRKEPLKTNEAVKFRAYYATMPSQKEVMTRYNISAKTFNSWLLDLGLEKHPPRARPQTTNTPKLEAVPPCVSLPKRRISDSTVVMERGEDQPQEKRLSIASRFRAVGQVNLNPYR